MLPSEVWCLILEKLAYRDVRDLIQAMRVSKSFYDWGRYVLNHTLGIRRPIRVKKFTMRHFLFISYEPKFDLFLDLDSVNDINVINKHLYVVWNKFDAKYLDFLWIYPMLSQNIKDAYPDWGKLFIYIGGCVMPRNFTQCHFQDNCQICNDLLKQLKENTKFLQVNDSLFFLMNKV